MLNCSSPIGCWSSDADPFPCLLIFKGGEFNFTVISVCSSICFISCILELLCLVHIHLGLLSLLGASALFSFLFYLFIFFIVVDFVIH